MQLTTKSRYYCSPSFPPKQHLMLSTLTLAVWPSLALALTLTASLSLAVIFSTIFSVVFDLLVEIIKRRPAEPWHILKRRHVAMLQHGLDVLHSTIRLPEIVLSLADVHQQSNSYNRQQSNGKSFHFVCRMFKICEPTIRTFQNFV
uniref:(northern house mosquito) hypothetical protein n=1 Tax=Culex pipiens TaxID=7175 RepID=A0A8D8DIN1_CULPI